MDWSSVIKGLLEIVKKEWGILFLTVFIIPVALTCFFSYHLYQDWVLSTIVGLIVALAIGIVYIFLEKWKKRKKRKKVLKRLAEDALTYLCMLDEHHYEGL